MTFPHVSRLIVMAALAWPARLAAASDSAATAVANESPETAASAGSEPTVTAVDYVDLERYVGLWYEIAKIPNRFQKDCVRGTTATYTLREDGRITVLNRCVEADEEINGADGVAEVVHPSHAKLRVSFVSFLGWRPFWGDYWVLGLDADYRWAAVGTPNRKYGWILAREPTLDESTLEGIFAIFERNGYDRVAFERSAP